MNEVTICNLALSHLGDTAKVTSIKPPDGSMQAQLCANFYPQARNSLLEMSAWGFALKRVALSSVTNPTVNSWTDDNGNAQTSAGTWLYAYAVPSDVANYIAVIPIDAVDDYEQTYPSVGMNPYPIYPAGTLPVPGGSSFVPQPFAIETVSGQEIVLTNVENAVLRYSAVVTDTTLFSALFTTALSYLLASMLAGPIIKGDAGMAVGMQMMQAFSGWFGKAVASDANQRKVNVQAAPSWIRGR